MLRFALCPLAWRVFQFHGSLDRSWRGNYGISEVTRSFVVAANRDAAAALVRLVTIASPDATKLDPAGLRAALALDLGGSQVLAAIGLRNRFAMLPDLAASSVSELVVNKTHSVIQDALVLAALRAGTVCDKDHERVFGALRRTVLIDVAPERFGDKALSDLVLALIQRGWNNDFAWAQSRQELDVL